MVNFLQEISYFRYSKLYNLTLFSLPLGIVSSTNDAFTLPNPDILFNSSSEIKKSLSKRLQSS